MALVPLHVIRHFVIYASGSALIKLLSLFLIPFLLYFVSPEEYGLLALAMSVAGILSRTLDLGLRQFAAIDYFRRPPEERWAFITDIVVLYSVISVPVLSLVALAAPYLQPRLFGTAASPLLLYIAIVHAFFYFYVELLYQVLRNEQQALQLTFLQAGATLGTMTFNIALAAYFHTGALGVIIGYSSSLCIITLYTGAFSGRRVAQKLESFNVHLRRGWSYLPLSLPLLPSTLLSWLLSSGDKWLLARYATLYDVGIYALADTVCQAYHLLILYPLSGSYIPHLVQQYAQQPNDIRAIERHNRTVMWLSLAGITTLSLSAFFIGKPLLYWLLPKHYHAVVPYIPLLLIGYILLTGTYFVSALIQFSQKRTFLAYSLVVPATVNLALNRFLIPKFGLAGSMYATIAAYALYFGGMLWYNARLVRRLTYLPATRTVEMGLETPKKSLGIDQNQTLSNVSVATPNTEQSTEHFEP